MFCTSYILYSNDTNQDQSPILISDLKGSVRVVGFSPKRYKTMISKNFENGKKLI